MMISFDNNKNKICLFFKDNVGRSYIKSHARSPVPSHNHKFYDHSVTIAFLFGISLNKQIIVKKLFAIS